LTEWRPARAAALCRPRTCHCACTVCRWGASFDWGSAVSPRRLCRTIAYIAERHRGPPRIRAAHRGPAGAFVEVPASRPALEDGATARSLRSKTDALSCRVSRAARRPARRGHTRGRCTHGIACTLACTVVYPAPPPRLLSFPGLTSRRARKKRHSAVRTEARATRRAHRL
jgi:hypothetical protein